MVPKNLLDMLYLAVAEFPAARDVDYVNRCDPNNARQLVTELALHQSEETLEIPGHVLGYFYSVL